MNEKYKVIDKFNKQLLNSPIGNLIIKIILFGSVLRRKPAAASDIDLLIITSGEIKKVDKICEDISYDLLINTEELIEPHVKCIDEYRFPDSYFLYRIKEVGKEVYSMDKEEIKFQEAKGYLDLAEYYINSSIKNFENKDYRIVVDIGYNAAELCVKGLLLFKFDELPTSHSGIVNKFSKLCLEEEYLDKELGKKLNKNLRLRNKARYEPHVEITKDNAQDIIDLSKTLHKFLSLKVEK
jgi:uncharacterized protein (UPF0332 family)/predicted nucleotidyltransferase